MLEKQRRFYVKAYGCFLSSFAKYTKRKRVSGRIPCDTFKKSM